MNNLENILAGRGDKGDVLEIIANMGSKGAKIAGAGLGAAGVHKVAGYIKENGLPSPQEVGGVASAVGKLGVYLAKAGLRGFVPTVKNKTKDIIKGVELRNK